MIPTCCRYLRKCIDTSPFQQDETKGRIVAVVKRLLLGLVLTAALGIGVYYWGLARPSILSSGLVQSFSMQDAIILSTLGLASTLSCMYLAGKTPNLKTT